MKIYIKLVVAFSCYFCCPAGKKALFKTGHKQPAKEVLLCAYVCMYACLCVQIYLYQ